MPVRWTSDSFSVVPPCTLLYSPGLIIGLTNLPAHNLFIHLNLGFTYLSFELGL
jgi:hypothetical protein